MARRLLREKLDDELARRADLAAAETLAIWEGEKFLLSKLADGAFSACATPSDVVALRRARLLINQFLEDTAPLVMSGPHKRLRDALTTLVTTLYDPPVTLPTITTAHQRMAAQRYVDRYVAPFAEDLRAVLAELQLSYSTEKQIVLNEDALLVDEDEADAAFDSVRAVVDCDRSSASPAPQPSSVIETLYEKAADELAEHGTLMGRRTLEPLLFLRLLERVAAEKNCEVDQARLASLTTIPTSAHAVLPAHPRALLWSMRRHGILSVCDLIDMGHPPLRNLVRVSFAHFAPSLRTVANPLEEAC